MGRQAHNLKVEGAPLLKKLVPESYNLTIFILYVTYFVKDVNDIYFYFGGTHACSFDDINDGSDAGGGGFTQLKAV
jgi:hypothetical protein